MRHLQTTILFFNARPVHCSRCHSSRYSKRRFRNADSRLKQGPSIRNQKWPIYNANGFTLIEIIIVIAVMAVLAGAMAPLVSNSIDRTREDVTKQRLITVFTAIVGPEDSQGSGFLADIGRLPSRSPNPLTELTNRFSSPVYSTGGHTGNVGMGWRGPYVTDGIDTSGRPIDGWGYPLDFGVVGYGQLRSAGRDHVMGDADDLVYPANALTIDNFRSTVNLSIQVLDNSATPPTYVQHGDSVRFYYAVDGAEQSALITSQPFSFILPHGIHAIVVTADPDGASSQPAVSSTLTIFCRGGSSLQQTIAVR